MLTLVMAGSTPLIDDHAKPIEVKGELKPVYRKLTNPAFIAGFPNGTKGQTAVVSAYRENQYRYNETNGRVHVVDRWICVPKP